MKIVVPNTYAQNNEKFQLQRCLKKLWQFQKKDTSNDKHNGYSSKMSIMGDDEF